MTMQYNSFETGLAPGTALTGANSGDGQAGTAFGTNFYQSAGATLTYANDYVVRGTLSGKIALATSSGASMGFNTGESAGFWTRAYFRYASVPTANTIIHYVRDGAVAASGFQVRLMTNGNLQLLDRAAFVGVASIPLSPGHWYRLELHVLVNGNWSWWVHQGDDETPLGTHSGTVSSTGAAKFDMCRWGAEGSSLVQTVWFDDVAWSDEAKLGSSTESASTTNTYVRVGGQWLPTTPHVRVDGQWELADGTPV